MNHRLNQLVKHRRFKLLRNKIHSVEARPYSKKEHDRTCACMLWLWSRRQMLLAYFSYPYRHFIITHDNRGKLSDTFTKLSREEVELTLNIAN